MIGYYPRKALLTHKDYFKAAFILSILLHFLILTIINPSIIPQKPERMSLSVIEFPATKPPVQIVSPPDIQTESRPDNPKYISDKDNKAEIETIKRGDLGGSPGQDTSAETSKKSVPIEAPKSPRETGKAKQNSETLALLQKPKQKKLKLQDQNLLSKYGEQQNEKVDANQSVGSSQPKEFSRASGSGAAFFGTRGTPDYLPQLPDGDLTLLNTKASQYAVFVRRVATRVFGQLRQNGWDSLMASDIHRITDMVTVEASLNPTGKLVEARILQGSGSTKFDEILLLAVKKGIEDQNPPPEAALDDGNFYFIFKSRSWSRGAINRSGLPTEQRWLLLGTGLK